MVKYCLRLCKFNLTFVSVIYRLGFNVYFQCASVDALQCKLTYNTLTIILILIVSELQCKKAIDQTLVQRVGLKLFVVTFVLTYTFYTLHFSSALTSSKLGIIICT